MELGDGRSWRVGGAQESFFFFPEFLFFILIVYFLRFGSILLCSDNGEKMIFASYLAVAPRAY